MAVSKQFYPLSAQFWQEEGNFEIETSSGLWICTLPIGSLGKKWRPQLAVYSLLSRSRCRRKRGAVFSARIRAGQSSFSAKRGHLNLQKERWVNKVFEWSSVTVNTTNYQFEHKILWDVPFNAYLFEMRNTKWMEESHPICKAAVRSIKDELQRFETRKTWHFLFS